MTSVDAPPRIAPKHLLYSGCLVAYDGPELEPRARRLLGRWDELDHTLDLSHKGRGGHMGPSNFMYNFYREFLNFDCPMPYATEQNQP